MFRNPVLLVVLALIVLVVGSASIYTVDESQKAILFRLGEIESVQDQPGLHFKMPIVNSVSRFDARIHTLDTQEESFLTSEKKNVIVDYFVNWRIDDVGKFFTSTGGGIELVAEQRLNQIVRDGLRGKFGKRTIQQVVSGERVEIMELLTREAAPGIAELGVELVDVRIKRIDLPQGVSSSVYERMVAERQRVAKDFRARGAETKERIQSAADREALVIVAEAERDAEKMRGEGDAKAADIYNRTYGQDEEFYRFYRSLNAYRNALSGKDDVLVMQPDSEFFKYFKQSGD